MAKRLVIEHFLGEQKRRILIIQQLKALKKKVKEPKELESFFFLFS